MEVTTEAESGLHTVDVSKGRVSWLYFNHSNTAVSLLQNPLYMDAAADGVPVTYAADETEVAESSEGGVDTVTLTHVDDYAQVEMVRTFRITGDTVDVDVQLRNLSEEDRELSLTLAHGTLGTSNQVRATREGDALDVRVGEDYKLKTEFPSAVSIGAGQDRDAALDDAAHGEWKDAEEKNARFQVGEYASTTAPGDTFHVQMKLSVEMAEGLADSDGDGFPDRWELEGFTTSDGTEFPLNAWGADPQKPDLFLQLNWMKSEWETLGCAARTHYAPTPADFAAFTACSRANTNTYRPSRESLNQLVKVFDRRGIRLHIDAGEYYTNIPGYTNHHGGPTEDYEKYYFGGGSKPSQFPGVKLMQERDRLLGPRADVFRVGIIGGQQSPSNYSSGTGLVRDGAFYVAKNDFMTSQEQLRNTILHEYGHNLGLTHSGGYHLQRPDSDYVPNYRSVMNYLYQFAHFDYSDTQSRPDANTPLPRACTDGSVRCYTGDYDIAPDWDHVEMVNGRVGSAQGMAGTSTPDGNNGSGQDGQEGSRPDYEDVETTHQSDVTVRDLEKNAAQYNDGKAGFRVRKNPYNPNVIVANRSDSTVAVEVTNLGHRPHNYTVEASYPGGKWSETVEVASALSNSSKKALSVPIANTTGYDKATMPIQFRVYNESGRLVADETQEFSVLTYTKADMQKLIDELTRTNSPLLAEAKSAFGTPDPGLRGASVTSPITTRPNATLTTPTRKPGVTDLGPAAPTKPTEPTEPTATPTPTTTAKTAPDSAPAAAQGSSTAGIAIGVILGLLTVLGIGVGVAAQAGLF
ncbi:hypothetical protein [Corynebacterium sp. HMSC071B10]|uniref:hypothetical protein n=1 Tax=Corynebacterium sp. HMSC071B10 TaxID=1739494 RepID=UPI0008A16FD5|nr:hypothetical protein [Corynebacterium sp. HMSC071B10]OFP34850.1 hypothetical protein HMPREF2990_09580 [Corynebacterium sp. HMSC071B10]